MIRVWALIRKAWQRCFRKDPTASIYACMMWTKTVKKVS